MPQCPRERLPGIGISGWETANWLTATCFLPFTTRWRSSRHTSDAHDRPSAAHVAI